MSAELEFSVSQPSSYHLPLIELARQTLSSGKPLWFRVTSNSMDPMISKDDSILVERCDLNTLQRGDMIVIQAGNELVVHRYLGVDQNSLITKGDRLVSIDPPVTQADYTGIVIKIKKAGCSLDTGAPIFRIVNRLLGFLGWMEYSSGRASSSRISGLTGFSRLWRSSKIVMVFAFIKAYTLVLKG